VDADVLVRLFTGDDPDKQRSAMDLLQRANRGEVSLAIAAITVAEVIWVMTSSRLYAIPRMEARTALLGLLQQSEIQIENRSTVFRALELYGTILKDFGDAMVVATMERERANALFAFDRGYDRIPSIERREP
jgi:predicted nucleic acid-binding protein